MTRIVYVNGDYLSEGKAKVSVFDRGFLFADAIYEVSAVIDGRLVDNDLHLDRLERSLREISIPLPMPKASIVEIQHELIRRNSLEEGVVYLQVGRGVADRDFGQFDIYFPISVGFQVLALPGFVKLADIFGYASAKAKKELQTAQLRSEISSKKSALQSINTGGSSLISAESIRAGELLHTNSSLPPPPDVQTAQLG